MTIKGSDIVLVDSSIIHSRVAWLLWKRSVLVIDHIAVGLHTESVIFALVTQVLGEAYHSLVAVWEGVTNKHARIHGRDNTIVFLNGLGCVKSSDNDGVSLRGSNLYSWGNCWYSRNTTSSKLA